MLYKIEKSDMIVAISVHSMKVPSNKNLNKKE